MDPVKNDADAASPAASEPSTAPAVLADLPSRATSATPTGIKSSPPAMASQVIEGADAGDASLVDAKNDSDAETVLLPGVNGHSPSKIRRERREIKLEDKSNESGIPDDVLPDGDVDMESTEGKETSTRSEVATSTLGKRKRSKNDHTRNSSVLSSAPASPSVVVEKASSQAPGTESESDTSKSSRVARKDKAKSVDRPGPKAEVDADAARESEKERKRFRRQQSSGADSSSNQHRRNGGLKSARGETDTRKATRSPSPPARSHRRSISSNATNGVSHKKKRVPAPLLATRDRASVDPQSDSSSSAGESPHPRGSRTRNLVTPPTGDSLNKMPRGKNPHHRTPLMNACDKGNLESARQFLRDKPTDLDAADPEGNTPLQCASLNGHADVVKMLLDAGCNIHTVNKEKDSPLLDAVENGHLDVVKLLLAAGVNPKQRNREGHEPLEKLREDAEDHDEIRAVLLKARASYVGNGIPRPSLPVHSPHPENESSSAKSRRTQSHGRSARTGDDMLYLSFDIKGLRTAAGIGDLDKVVNILNVLGQPDDIQTLVAAARGGHDEVLGIILALTGMNPDSPPLKDTEWEHATPMLAAIGGENIKVIEMLLRHEVDGGSKFDPTRVYNNMTYPEWAKYNKGPLWQEEERILQEAFDQYKRPSKNRSSANTTSPTRTHGHRQRLSDHSGRTNGSTSRDQGSTEISHARKRAASPGATAVPVKRGPGRPRKEGRDNEAQDREAASHKEKTKRRRSHSDDEPSSPEAEAGAAKPRRKKLLSGKEMKEEQQIRQRRASFASMGSAASTVGDTAPESKKSSALGKTSTPRLSSGAVELDTVTEKSATRSRKDGEGKDRITAMRDDSPAKRARSSMTPPSSPRSDHGIATKRRRLEGINRGEARHSSSPDRRSQLNEKRQSSPHSIDKKPKLDNPLKKPIKKDPVSPSPEERLAAEQKIEAEKKQAELEAKRAAEQEASRQAEEAARRAEEAARRAAEAAKEEEERKKAEEMRIAVRMREERELAEKLAKEEEERQQRQKEREAEAARREEEAKQRQLELERQRKEEREQKQREMEHQREERRRRKEKEEEEARLAKLPALLQWFDRERKPATTEIASKFTTIQGVRYDTIQPEASGSPDAKEQWVLNTQVALLLGEKDLQLSRYTAWERIPVSQAAKMVFWGLENSRYAMLDSATGKHNPEFWFNERIGSWKPPRAAGRLEALRNEARKLFFALDLTFVKLSDFLSVIHLHPHLRNLRLKVEYRELPPPGWTFESLIWPSKWKEDVDAKPDANGNGPFTPGARFYINGQLTQVEEKVKYSPVSNTPFPQRLEDRVPRRDLRQVFPHHSDYTQVCLEQGLTHLVPNGTIGNGNGVRVTPPASNASTSEEPRRPSETSPVSQSAMQELVNGPEGGL